MVQPDRFFFPSPKIGTTDTPCLEITVHNEGRVLFLSLRGELEAHTKDKLAAAVESGISAPHCTDIVVDMTAVSFVDSSGMGILMRTRQALAARVGRVHLAGCDASLLRLLSVSRLSRAFPVHATLASARVAVAGLLTA